MELSQEVIEQIKAEAEKRFGNNAFFKSIPSKEGGFFIECAKWLLTSHLPSLCGWVRKEEMDEVKNYLKEVEQLLRVAYKNYNNE